MKKLLKNKQFDLIAAVLLITLGAVMLILPKDFGLQMLELLTALALTLYIVFDLIDRVRGSRGTVRILTIVELAVVMVLALGMLLQQFRVLRITEVCSIVGLLLWMRGCIGLIRGNLLSVPESRKQDPVWHLFVSIAMVTVGTWQFVRPLMENRMLVYVLAAAAVLLGLYLCYLTVCLFTGKSATIQKTAFKTAKK